MVKRPPLQVIPDPLALKSQPQCEGPNPSLALLMSFDQTSLFTPIILGSSAYTATGIMRASHQKTPSNTKLGLD